MADGEDSTNLFTAGVANFRETTKWLVAGTVAVAAGVLAGSPLTGLGSLEFGPRLGMAVGSAGLAFFLLGIILWRALGVVAADTVTASSLAHATGDEAAVRRRIEARLKDGLPFGCETLAMLELEGQLRADDDSSGSDARYGEFVAAMAAFNPALGFEYKRDRFIRMRNTTVMLMPVVILSIGVFAWATSPPDEPSALTDTPVIKPLILNREAVALLPECYGRDRLEVRALVNAEFPGGRTDYVVLPTKADCPPVRLTRQNGRVFVTE